MMKQKANFQSIREAEWCMCRYKNLRAEVGLRSNTQISSRRATTQKGLKNKSPLRCPPQVTNKRTRETIWGAETQKIVQMARTRGRLSMGFGGSENGRDSLLLHQKQRLWGRVHVWAFLGTSPVVKLGHSNT